MSYVPQQDENKEEDGALRHLSECKKTGFQESIICLSQIALHGLIVNGLLLWADIQHRTAPSKEWKEKALIHFNDEEISNAKNLLWDVSNEEIIGKKVNRQGPSKQESEINDIELALNALAEEERIPLFVASSSMVMQTPGQEHTQPGLKDIEEMMDSVLKKRVDQLIRKCDQTVSKADQGNKKMDEVIKQLGSIERSGPNSVRFAQRPGVSLLTPTIAGSTQPIGNGNIHTPVHQNARI